MFSKNQDKSGKQPAYTEKVSVIAGGMVLTGDMESEGDVRIDGTVCGNIFCKSKVVIIKSGKVVGDIQAANVDIHGAVSGNITARELLSLKAHCRIDGNLTADKLQIEPNATFNGHCTMAMDKKSPFSKVNEAGILEEQAN